MINGDFVDIKVEVWQRHNLPDSEEAEKCAHILNTYGFEALQDYLSELIDEDKTEVEYLYETEQPVKEGRYVEIYRDDKCLAEKL